MMSVEKALFSSGPRPSPGPDAGVPDKLREGRNLQVLREDGFIEIQILTTYFVFALTLLAFLLGLAFGVWKQAYAKYTWFSECLDFAAQAANTTGDIKEVRLNQNKARQYFIAAMKQTVKDYTLTEFRAVAPGERVPNGVARAPGYVAGVTVPVFEGKVPLIGYQKVSIPMKYYAVVKSKQMKK